MDIQILSPSCEPSWQDYVNSHPDATAYHTLEWRDILRKGFGYEPLYLMALSGEKIEGVFPLFLVSTLSGRKIVSLPFSIYGGALCSRPSAFLVLADHAKSLLEEKKAEYLLIRSARKIEKNAAAEAGLYESDVYLNFVVSLEGGQDALWKRIRNRKEIRRAERSGLSAAITGNDDALEEFYRLQLITRKRQGLPTPGFDYYKSFFAVEGLTRVVLVRKGGRAVAGGLFFLFRDSILYVFGASDLEYQEFRPNDMMIWEMMKWGCEKGYGSLNLAKAFVDDENLIRFKMKWAPEKAGCPDYYYPPEALGKIAGMQRAGRRRGAAIFRHLPVSVARYIGHPIIRYFA